MDWPGVSVSMSFGQELCTYLDLGIHGHLFRIILLVVVWVHANVVECKLFLDAILEDLPLLQGQTIGLGDDRNHVDRLAQLLEHDDIDWLEGVTGGRDEVQAAVDAGVLDVALALCGELLSEVGAVLVLDVLDDWVPAAVVVDEVAISRSVDDVQAEAHAVLLNDVGDGVDFGGLATGLGGSETTLAVDKVRGEDGVDEGRFPEAGLSWKRRIRVSMLRKNFQWLLDCGWNVCTYPRR